MGRRKWVKNPMAVTSFRLPQDVFDFLKTTAKERDRTMSYVLVEVLRLWMRYTAAEGKQPRVRKPDANAE